MNTARAEKSFRLEMCRRLTLMGAAILVVSMSACGPADGSFESEAPHVQTQEMNVDNGLSLNGLSLNGLSLNGLSLNGLSNTAFSGWFQANPALNNTLMKYIVRCAVPAGQTRTYTDPIKGTTYHWAGSLGLAPDWASGIPTTLTEQRLISACLAAHTNKYGVHVPISVLGQNARGEPLPYSVAELTLFSKKEACFFGNLFNGEGIFASNDGRSLGNRESTPRACALPTYKNVASQMCAPLVRVEQDCSTFCTLDASRNFYTSCTYNGITYPAITTRMLPSNIHVCGDGICQVTETCGTSDTYDSCFADCGACP